MTYEEFLISYESIIKKSLSRLKENRFAIFTVGDLRDDKGFYKNFVEDTVKIFERNGARKCNIDKIPDDFERLDLTENAQADIFGF